MRAAAPSLSRFDRYTPAARKAVVLAELHARRLKHRRIGTDHLLLGLASCSLSTSSRALTSVGVVLEELDMHMRRTHRPGRWLSSRQSSPVPFDPDMRTLIEQLRRGAGSSVSTADLLVAVAGLGEHVAVELLGQLGLGSCEIKQALSGVELAEGAHDSVLSPMGMCIHE